MILAPLSQHDKGEQLILQCAMLAGYAVQQVVHTL